MLTNKQKQLLSFLNLHQNIRSSGAIILIFSPSNILLITLDLIPKFVFSGITPKFLLAYFKSNLATATPITFPLSFNIGPPLLPGWIAASI